jgi:hypothetical protein
MKIYRIPLALVASVFLQSADAQGLGRYVGTLKTDWLDDGRQMQLLERFVYIDAAGVEWPAPAGAKIHGASIPRVAWTAVGGPYEGKYRAASVIHGVACEEKKRPWETVHETFYWGMLTSGEDPVRAKVMYAAVYHFGPRWDRAVNVNNVPTTQTVIVRQQALKGAPSGSEAQIVGVMPRKRSLNEILTNQPQRGDFTVLIRPPRTIPPQRGLLPLSKW